mmetsp:Transcript_76093/g.215649  ORF Transcript_76093/g.215649 Transcript_76093/m.215649 type:complete len:218 (+) Transcript_76093:500-1153(+)
MRIISASKARNFHSSGDDTSGDSYAVLADRSLTFSKMGSSVGRNFAQLSSIQPRCAFVTSTTSPCCFAAASVSAAALATSASSSRCAAVRRELPSSRRPWHCTHVEGNTVSSQSNMKIVSSAGNLTADSSSGAGCAQPPAGGSSAARRASHGPAGCPLSVLSGGGAPICTCSGTPPQQRPSASTALPASVGAIAWWRAWRAAVRARRGPRGRRQAAN